MRSGPYSFACEDIEEEQEPPVVVVGGPTQDTCRVEEAADNGVEIGRLKRSVSLFLMLRLDYIVASLELTCYMEWWSHVGVWQHHASTQTPSSIYGSETCLLPSNEILRTEFRSWPSQLFTLFSWRNPIEENSNVCTRTWIICP